MNNRGKSLILWDLVIVVLLAALIYSFIRPNRLSHLDLKSQADVEKGLSTLQVAMDMYSTRYNGVLPGIAGDDVNAVGTIIDDIEESEVFVFDEIDFEKIRSSFAAGIQGTKYEKTSNGYNIIVFAKDRSPHKYIMTGDKIEAVDPQKKLIEYLGVIDGLKKDVDAELLVFDAVVEKSKEVADDIAELKKNDEEGNFEIINTVYDSVKDATSIEAINQEDYETAKKMLQLLAIKVEGIKNVKSMSFDSVQAIGKAGFEAEDAIANLNELSSYLKAGKLVRQANSLHKQAEDVMRFANDKVDELYPKQNDLVALVDEHGEALDKFDGMLLEYKTKMQFVVQKFVDLKKQG